MLLAAAGGEIEGLVGWRQPSRPSSTGTAALPTWPCTRACTCSVRSIDAGVTGGSIGAEKSRLDFDLEEAPDKEALWNSG